MKGRKHGMVRRSENREAKAKTTAQIIGKMPETPISDDIWLAIAGFPTTSDLNSLCLCSKRFLNLYRPALYQEVTFKSTRYYRDDYIVSHTNMTLQLLISTPSLTKCVRHFHVSIWQKEYPLVRLPEAVLAMDYLETLQIHGDLLFPNAREQKVFIKKFKERGRPLQDIIFGCNFPEPNEGLGIAGLTKFGWTREPQKCLCHLLSASSTTLTKLHFHFETDFYVRLLDRVGFWDLRLPRLQIFSVRWDWNFELGFFLTGNVSRKEFFLAHRTVNLVEVSLFAAFAFSGRLFEENIQPSLGLRYLEGCDRFYEKVVHHSIAQDRSLNLSEEVISDLTALVKSLYQVEPEKLSPFAPVCLEEISIPFMQFGYESAKSWESLSENVWSDGAPGPFLDFLHLCSNTLGRSLRVLSGRIPPIPGLTVKALGTALRGFPRLEIVHLSEELVAQSGCRNMETFTLELAVECESLKGVVFVLSMERGVSISIGRSSIMGEVQVIDKHSVSLYPRSFRVRKVGDGGVI